MSVIKTDDTVNEPTQREEYRVLDEEEAEVDHLAPSYASHWHLCLPNC